MSLGALWQTHARLEALMQQESMWELKWGLSAKKEMCCDFANHVSCISMYEKVWYMGYGSKLGWPFSGWLGPEEWLDNPSSPGFLHGLAMLGPYPNTDSVTW